MKISLMTHIVAGYPTMAECEKIALTMADCGVSYIEIQIPFSDPIADGKTILKANTKSLENGTTPDDCFDLIKRLKRRIKIPILLMTYFNILFNYGVEKFCRKAQKAGCYGLIVPDIPFDEESHEHYLKFCKKYDLKAIQVISPITPARRLKKIAKAADGFVYCVSAFGTTGERLVLNADLDFYLDKVRKYIDLPIALGFGISNKQQVLAAGRKADIVVVGSKILNIYNNSSRGEGIGSIKSFLESF